MAFKLPAEVTKAHRICDHDLRILSDTSPYVTGSVTTAC
jgi:hypothetical protein